MVQFAKRAITGVWWWQTGTTGSLESASTRADLDPDRWQMHHVSTLAFLLEKPMRQQAEDLLDPKDTSRGICTYVCDPTSLGYGRIFWSILDEMLEGSLCGTPQLRKESLLHSGSTFASLFVREYIGFSSWQAIFLKKKIAKCDSWNIDMGFCIACVHRNWLKDQILAVMSCKLNFGERKVF